MLAMRDLVGVAVEGVEREARDSASRSVEVLRPAMRRVRLGAGLVPGAPLVHHQLHRGVWRPNSPISLPVGVR